MICCTNARGYDISIASSSFMSSHLGRRAGWVELAKPIAAGRLPAPLDGFLCRSTHPTFSKHDKAVAAFDRREQAVLRRGRRRSPADRALRLPDGAYFGLSASSTA